MPDKINQLDIISFADKLNNKIRELLLQIEDQRQAVKNVEPKDCAGIEALRQISSYLNSALSTLLVLSDFLFEITTCEDISEIEFLLKLSKENCEIEN